MSRKFQAIESCKEMKGEVMMCPELVCVSVGGVKGTVDRDFLVNRRENP